jgi:hypothetical protein
MELIIRTFDLLQHTFSISRKSINTQPTAIVELRWEGISMERLLQILTTISQLII